MGFEAGAALLSAAASIGSSMYSGRKQDKAQKRAEAQAREAAKRNVTVQTSAPQSTRESAAAAEEDERARLNAKRRRQGYASTLTDRGLTNRGLTSSLVGNNNTLG